MRRVTTTLAALVCALSAVACGNPVQDNLIRSLGPEKPGVRRGPLHRPGQPCLACHSAAGGRHPYFSVAGTVYQTQDPKSPPARGVIIELTDAQKRVFKVATNCAGNFYVQQKDFQPIYPMHVKLHYGGVAIPPMVTAVNRDGSCATCHAGPLTWKTLGHLYVDPNAVVVFPKSSCP